MPPPTREGSSRHLPNREARAYPPPMRSTAKLVIAIGLVSLSADVGAQRDASCHPSYVNVCIPPPPPDLDCSDLDECDIEVQGSDPHRLDRDHDGIACECR